MADLSRPTTRSPGARGTGTEAWLLCVGSSAQLEDCLAAFAAARLDLVLAPPGVETDRWSGAFARAHAAKRELVPGFQAGSGAEGRAEVAARAAEALEQALGAGAARLLVVLHEEVLLLVVANALRMPLERVSSLRVDAGRAVLLRDDPIGLVLRHSNVGGPPAHSGTALPGGPRQGAR